MQDTSDRLSSFIHFDMYHSYNAILLQVPISRTMDLVLVQYFLTMLFALGKRPLSMGVHTVTLMIINVHITLTLESHVQVKH